MKDLIGELLRANLLRQIGDDEQRVERLRAASRSLGEDLARGAGHRLPSALLSAVDGNGADWPMVSKAHRALLEKWETLANAFADHPVELFRAVLLDASVAAFTRDGNTIAAGWYVLRSAVEQAPTSRWEPVLRRLLAEWDGEVGGQADRAWLTGERKLAAERAEGEAEPETVPGQDDVEDRGIDLMSDVGPAGEPREPADPPAIAADSLARKRAAEIAATAGYAHLINQLSALVDELLGASELAAAQAVARSPLGEVHDRLRLMELKTELLWWKESSYSISRRRCYGELTPGQAVIAAALDLHNLVDAISPVSVEHVLYDTVAGAVDHEVTVAALADCEWSEDLAGLGEPPEATLLHAIVSGGRTPLVEPAASLPAARAAVLLFRDLQAARLLRTDSP